MSNFKVGDRVQLNPQTLKLCDPAISDNEIRGVVITIDDNEIRVRFDNGDIEQHPASRFELEKF